MRFKKEIILIIGISIFIILLEIVTNRITENSVKKVDKKIVEINSDLSKIRNINVDDPNYENYQKGIEEKIKVLKKEWFEVQDKLSIFAEHDELEKVSKCLIVLEENAKNEEYETALEDGIEFLYWLNHIKEKDKLELKNIF